MSECGWETGVALEGGCCGSSMKRQGLLGHTQQDSHYNASAHFSLIPRQSEESSSTIEKA